MEALKINYTGRKVGKPNEKHYPKVYKYIIKHHEVLNTTVDEKISLNDTQFRK